MQHNHVPYTQSIRKGMIWLCLIGVMSIAGLAQAAGVLILGASATGSLAVSGGSDLWQVTTPADGILRINVVSSAALEADIVLYDTDNTTELKSDSGSGTNSTIQQGDLAPGTFYIHVNQWSGAGNYTITATFTAQPIGNDTGINDTAANALTLAANGSRTGHLGYYAGGVTDTDDWYKVVVPADGRLQIVVTTDATLEADPNLYDTDGSTHCGMIGEYGVTTTHCTGRSGPRDLLPASA